MSDVTETAIYVAAGAYIVPKVADMVMSFFKGSVTRNIEAADKAAERTQERLDELETEVVALKHSHENHKGTMASTLGQIDGRLQALDTRIAKQGEAYEAKIEDGFRKLEIELNRKLAQVVSELAPRRRGRG